MVPRDPDRAQSGQASIKNRARIANNRWFADLISNISNKRYASNSRPPGWIAITARTMFEDLYDLISRLWSFRWPCAYGVVTEVFGEHAEHRNGNQSARLAVAYEFSIGDDGPYTGECFWTPAFGSIPRVAKARRKVHNRQRVQVRYRRDDPSVNTLDGAVARLLKRKRGDRQS
jgi:hypothetical protein